MNKVNVYGSFAEALFFSGTVAIPKYLLTHYMDIGLSDQEMILIIHILSEGERNTLLSPETLAQKMRSSKSKIEECIVNLQERRLLKIDKHWNTGEHQWNETYSIVGLIDELAEFWAIEQVKKLEQERRHEEKLISENKPDPHNFPVGRIVNIFEQELGRPLTGLECEQINNWLASHFSEELIIEALRRGVSAGIRTFRYLDSILREWEKKGLRTRAEVENDDLNFQSRQDKKHKAKQRTDKKMRPDKYENFYL